MPSSFDAWLERHATLLLTVAGVVALAIAWRQPPGASPEAFTGLMMFGFGAVSVASLRWQSGYFRRTLGRDWREGFFYELDPAIVYEHVAPPLGSGGRYASGRDLRETLSGAEVAISLTVTTIVGLFGAAACVAFAWSSLALSDVVRSRAEAWSIALKWGGPALAGIIALLLLVVGPATSLTHWFKSRRLISRRDSDSLRKLAVAAERSTGSLDR